MFLSFYASPFLRISLIALALLGKGQACNRTLDCDEGDNTGQSSTPPAAAVDISTEEATADPKDSTFSPEIDKRKRQFVTNKILDPLSTRDQDRKRVDKELVRLSTMELFQITWQLSHVYRLVETNGNFIDTQDRFLFASGLIPVDGEPVKDLFQATLCIFENIEVVSSHRKLGVLKALVSLSAGQIQALIHNADIFFPGKTGYCCGPDFIVEALKHLSVEQINAVAAKPDPLHMSAERIKVLIEKRDFFFKKDMDPLDISSIIKSLRPLSANKIRILSFTYSDFFPRDINKYTRSLIVEAIVALNLDQFCAIYQNASRLFAGNMTGYDRQWILKGLKSMDPIDIWTFSQLIEENAGALFIGDMTKEGRSSMAIGALLSLEMGKIKLIVQGAGKLFSAGVDKYGRSEIIKVLGVLNLDQIETIVQYADKFFTDSTTSRYRVLIINALARLSAEQIKTIAQDADEFRKAPDTAEDTEDGFSFFSWVLNCEDALSLN